MLKRTKIIDLLKSEKTQSEVLAKGWVRTRRDVKDFSFIEINDGSCLKNLQIIANSNLPNYNEVKTLSTGSSIAVTGALVESQGGNQKYEVVAEKIEIYSIAPDDFPMQKKRHSDEYLRTIAHLRPRSNKYGAAFRVRSTLSYAIHKFFQERGFVYVHTPIITSSDAEGAGEMFTVTNFDFNNLPKTDDGKVDFSKDFFDKQTHLTVSGQLDVENFAHAFRNVYTFGPTFRAENSNTVKHAAEFWMIEPEICFADLNDDINLAEDMIKYIVKYVLDELPEEMAFLDKFIEPGLIKRLENIINSDFGRISYTDAIKELEKVNDTFEFPVEWGTDIQTEHERYISEKIFGKPVFVTDYPKDIKAFYMKLNDDGKTVAATDMLVPGIGELIGGSQREDNFEKLQARIKELNMDEQDYWWYLNLRRYGSCVHSGFGLGFERMMMFLTGIQNIRDTIPFPRTPKNCDF